MFLKRKTIWNILKVAISNVIILISSILVGFLLPKIVNIQDYGYYKTFTLYASYVGLVHSGITDGIYLKYGGKSYEDLESEKSIFRTFNLVVLLLDLFFSTSLFVSSLFIAEQNIKFILIALATFLIVNNMVGHFQIISQITNRFNELAIKNSIQSFLTIILIVSIWFFYHQYNYSISYKLYTILYIAIIFGSLLYYLVRYRSIVFGRRARLSESKQDIIKLIKIGLPLLIANLCTGFILTIDRQIVNIFWPVSVSNDYSIYAFAYNLLSLVTIAISAISTVLYPTLKNTNQELLKSNYSNLIDGMLSLGFICLLLYFPLCLFIEWFLPKYIDSLKIFRVVFPGIVLSSTISVVIHNYYKVVGKNTRFFIYSLLILLLSLASDIAVYFIFKSTISISVASVFCIFIWFMLTDVFLVKRYSLNCFKNYSLIAVLLLSFYLVTLINNYYIGFGVHVATTLFVVYIYHYRHINSFVKTRFFGRKA